MNKTQSKNQLFYNKGCFYKIEQIKYETRESHMERVWYIFDNLEKDKSFDELKRLSLVWSNVKKLDCEYNKTLMDDIIK